MQVIPLRTPTKSSGSYLGIICIMRIMMVAVVVSVISGFMSK